MDLPCFVAGFLHINPVPLEAEPEFEFYQHREYEPRKPNSYLYTTSQQEDLDNIGNQNKEEKKSAVSEVGKQDQFHSDQDPIKSFFGELMGIETKDSLLAELLQTFFEDFKQ